MSSSKKYQYPHISSVTKVSPTNEIYPSYELSVEVTVSGEGITQEIPVSRQIVLILDTSGSMGHEGRIIKMKEAATAIIDILQPAYDEVGIIIFNNNTTVNQFTNDFKQAKKIYRTIWGIWFH
ncbi:MAG: VWA domain-containing protein [Cocleimonas sp.]|nr:VWA domain-containing protein [Cocleimonas sp.]